MATNIETMDFNNTGDNMVSLESNSSSLPPPLPSQQPPPIAESTVEIKDDTYEKRRNNIENNNIHKEQMMDLSTPLDDVMGSPEQQAMMPPPPQAQPDQSMMMAPPQPQMHQQQAAPQQQARAPRTQKNFGDLTDDQMDAIIAAVAAVVAFSPQIREKMVVQFPTMFTEAGNRTLAGSVTTGLICAAIFYGIKKFVLKH